MTTLAWSVYKVKSLNNLVRNDLPEPRTTSVKCCTWLTLHSLSTTNRSSPFSTCKKDDDVVSSPSLMTEEIINNKIRGSIGRFITT
jgi:hypothetical protein